jgi:hypothetical protein
LWRMSLGRVAHKRIDGAAVGWVSGFIAERVLLGL